MTYSKLWQAKLTSPTTATYPTTMATHGSHSLKISKANARKPPAKNKSM